MVLASHSHHAFDHLFFSGLFFGSKLVAFQIAYAPEEKKKIPWLEFSKMILKLKGGISETKRLIEELWVVQKHINQIEKEKKMTRNLHIERLFLILTFFSDM